MTFLPLLLASYLLGAIPFGYLVAKARGVDILKAGSGNIGATNVGRVLGKGPGLAVWGLDVLKSLLPTLAARALLPHGVGPLAPETSWFLVGLAAVVGHCASPFLGFRGGKGISTALGAIVGTAPLVAVLCFALFAGVLATTRYMAIASTVGIVSVVLFGWLFHLSPQILPVFALAALFVAYRHRSNFRRLREGTEPRFSFKKAGAPVEEAPASLPGSSEPAASFFSTDSGERRLRLANNAQLADPHTDGKDGSQTVQIIDTILEQFLASDARRLEMVYGFVPDVGEIALKIEMDGRPNGRLPLEIATSVLRRFGLLAGMDPLKERQSRTGRIAGTFDDAPFELAAESFPITDGVAFALVREPL